MKFFFNFERVLLATRGCSRTLKTPNSPPLWVSAQWCTLADPGGGATEAMASPKRQTREAKLCFGLPQTGQWVYLVSTESTNFTGFVT